MAPVTQYIFAEMLGISEHFRSYRGIATTSVRTGLAMTGNLEQSDKHQFDGLPA